MNVVNLIKHFKDLYPYKKAVVVTRGQDKQGNNIYSHLTYSDLWQRSDDLAFKLTHKKIKKGDKVLLFVRPSIEFSILTLALFKMGAIPVLIDPGMGRKNLLKAISEVAPDIFITEKLGVFLRKIFFWHFSSVRETLSTGDLAKIIYQKSDDDLLPKRDEFPIASFEEDEMAAILFTSGGTGAPKGVVYTHKIFTQQVLLLKDMFKLSENDIDLPGFPFFYLFSLSMGMTVVFADMDPTKPSLANPEKLIRQIQDFGVTFAAGSPSIWKNVAVYGTEKKIVLESIKTLAMFGAPVRMELHQMFRSILPNGDTFTPYGATEALPLTVVSGKSLLSEAYDLYNEGKGLLVGWPVKGIEIKIIKSVGKMLSHVSEMDELPPRQVGEIIVSGVNVTTEYYKKSIPTAMSKIHDPDKKKIWHRMGDVGFLDDHGRLWFMGRKDHQVSFGDQTLYPVQIEAIYDRHPKVKKSVLIGTHIPSIVIERIDGRINLPFEEKTLFEKELKDLAQNFDEMRPISHFHYVDKLPVDIRHQIKIDRVLLKNQFSNESENLKRQ